MILVPFYARSTLYGSTKNLLSLPFQAPVFYDLDYTFISDNRVQKDRISYGDGP